MNFDRIPQLIMFRGIGGIRQLPENREFDLALSRKGPDGLIRYRVVGTVMRIAQRFKVLFPQGNEEERALWDELLEGGWDELMHMGGRLSDGQVFSVFGPAHELVFDDDVNAEQMELAIAVPQTPKMRKSWERAIGLPRPPKTRKSWVG